MEQGEDEREQSNSSQREKNAWVFGGNELSGFTIPKATMTSNHIPRTQDRSLKPLQPVGPDRW